MCRRAHEAGACQRPPGLGASLVQPVAPPGLDFAQLRDRLGPTPAHAADVVARWERSARDYETRLRTTRPD
jgi:hypothetical protein